MYNVNAELLEYTIVPDIKPSSFVIQDVLEINLKTGEVKLLKPLSEASQEFYNKISELINHDKKQVYRHKKRGTEYVLLGIGKMQAENWAQVGGTESPLTIIAPIDMREVAIYQSVDDNKFWVRPKEEFEDGRFEKVNV